MNSTERFQKLIDEVGEWAKRNFGEGESKWLPKAVNHEECVAPNCLHHIGPLLGIFEECGELAEAGGQHQVAESRDAIGDIIIYLADYFSRAKLPADLIIWDGGPKSPFPILPVTMGRLAHVNLKRHQGIRGFDDWEYFLTELKPVLQNLVYWIQIGVRVHVGTDNHPLDIGEETWERVKLRDWKKNPANANKMAPELPQ